MRSIVFCLILLFNCRDAFCYLPKAGNVNAIVGPVFNQTVYTGNKSEVEPPTQAGVGLIGLGDANDSGSIEIGVFFMPKVFIMDTEEKYISERTQTVHITFGYRYWVTSFLSGSLSFYSAYTMGTPQLLYSDFAVGEEQRTSAYDTTEYGFDGALQAEVWHEGPWGVIMDVRYSRSVTPKGGEDANHFSGLVGIRYLIQEKDKEELEKN